MAVNRTPPTCLFCGKPIAKAIMKKSMTWKGPVYGDNFSHWKYFKHNCKGKKKWLKEHPKVTLDGKNHVQKKDN